VQLAIAPDGNGGVYLALEASGCLQHMQDHGIEGIDCCSVDNAAARVLDPLCLGAFHSSGVSVGSRVLSKAYPEEAVGVFARCELYVICSMRYIR
jgi:UDP-N-acetylglucosamine/UDP-N-acetylgalactosamine diphosphorylase